MFSEELLLVFVKNSRKGRVKTRLAESVGQQKALEIYKQLLHYTRDVVAPLTIDIQVWYSDFIPLRDLWDDIGVEKRTQWGSDLGERMKHAFERAQAEGYERTAIIGSDCAELTTDHIRQALGDLKDHNTVIGPSADGGYYLLGMDNFYGSLFENKDWSSGKVYSQTISDIEALDLTYSRLSRLNDVDTAEDWDEVKFRFADSST